MKRYNKHNNIHWQILPFLLLLLFPLFSCDDMEDKPHSEDFDIAEPVRFYVLSEGLFNNNNSTLALYDLRQKVKVRDYFQIINSRKLGDTANDAVIYGSKMYIVVNVSGTIEILDLQSGKSLKQLSMQNEKGVNRQPRYIAAFRDKIYICAFDGTVSRLDTLSLQIDATLAAGKNPDGICVSRNKIYVTNSGGLSFPFYDNTVSVIDVPSFSKVEDLTVGINPCKPVPDSEGDIYLVSRGNYGTEKSRFCKISSNNQITIYDSIQVTDFDIYRDTAYLYEYDLITKQSVLKLYDCITDRIIASWQTDLSGIETPNGMNINPVNGDIYLADAKNYTILGDVLCFNNSGMFKFRIREAGLNPRKIIFE